MARRVAALLHTKIPFTNVRHYTTQSNTALYSQLCRHFPVEIRHTKDKGRGLFVKRRIVQNMLICEDEPIVSCSSLYMKANEYCANCYLYIAKQKDTSSCQHCNEVYCSDACKDNAWKTTHEVLCKSKNANPEMTAFGKELTELEKHCKFHNRRYPLLAGHVLARILQDAKRGKSVNEDSPVCDDVIRSLAFATHEEPEWKEDYTKLAKVFFGDSIPPENYSYEWYKRIMQVFHINALTISPEFSPLSSTPTAHFDPVGLYPLLSYANHSCAPNARVIHLDSAHARLVAARRIEEDEEVSITYVNPELSYEERQKHLRQQYGFECQCSKCVEESVNAKVTPKHHKH